MSNTRRSTILSHLLEGRIRRCPMCQWVIDQDYDEAVAMNGGRLPDEFGFELIAAAAAQDSADRSLNDNDLVFFIDPRNQGPNDTLPFTGR